MKKYDNKVILEDLSHSTLYAVKIEAILLDNNTQKIAEQQCLKTKVDLKPNIETKLDCLQFGGTITLKILETTFQMFKLYLNVEGSDKLDSNSKIHVKCSHIEEDKWTTEDVDFEKDDVMAMYKVVPNTKYNCSGTVIDDDEIIMIKEISIYTCSEKDIKIETVIEDIKSKYFRQFFEI